MGGKHRPVVEGVAYFFTVGTWTRRMKARDAVDDALRAARCGRVVGSGTSFFDDGTLVVEFQTRDPYKARSAVARASKRKGLANYEVECE
jgi:hypothetical protein